MDEIDIDKTSIRLLDRTLQRVCMPEFKPVTMSDLPQIRSVLQRAVSRSCDYSVGGIFLWINWFKYEYCIRCNTLFIKGLSENDPNVTAFSMPIGEMSLEQSVEILRLYCRTHGLPLVLSAIPEDCLSRFDNIKNAGLEPLDAWSDYIYNATDLATLAGKKLQKKRNHFNRFVAENPDYKFEVIDNANYDELGRFFANLRNDDTDCTTMACYEADNVARLLREHNPIGFDGALLRNNSGNIAAFTFGEVIGDTLHVHIEKMRHDINGAGAAVNKLFVEHMLGRYQGIKYVNRQDDAGDPGLRQAKLSYNPTFILKKYNIHIKH
jgi:hypothetical protein